jgi:MFS family permease
MQGGTGGGVFTAEERRIVHFCGAAHAATHYVELVYPTLAVALAAEIGIPLERVLGWSFAGYLLFGAGALPAGLAADRFGARRVILWGLVVAGASCLAAALAAPGWPIGLCLAGLGTGASLYHPAGTGLLSRAVAARGRALGLNGIYGNLGIAFSPLLTATLVGALGWRWTFAATGGTVLVAALAFSRLRIREPQDAPPSRAAAPAGPVASRRLLAFALLCSIATLAGFGYRGNTVAQPALFAEQIDFMGYGAAASLTMLVGIFGQYLGGRVADRRDLRWSYFVFHLASLPMLLVLVSSTGLPLLAASAGFVFFALGMQPIENSLFAQVTPERWRSTAYGLKFVLTFGVGASAVVMVRWVGAAWGWVGVYQVLAFVVAAMVLGILVLIRISGSGEEGDLPPFDGSGP